jgi:hypothetical protein
MADFVEKWRRLRRRDLSNLVTSNRQDQQAEADLSRSAGMMRAENWKYFSTSITASPLEADIRQTRPALRLPARAGHRQLWLALLRTFYSRCGKCRKISLRQKPCLYISNVLD